MDARHRTWHSSPTSGTTHLDTFYPNVKSETKMACVKDHNYVPVKCIPKCIYHLCALHLQIEAESVVGACPFVVTSLEESIARLPCEPSPALSGRQPSHASSSPACQVPCQVALKLSDLGVTFHWALPPLVDWNMIMLPVVEIRTMAMVVHAHVGKPPGLDKIVASYQALVRLVSKQVHAQ